MAPKTQAELNQLWRDLQASEGWHLPERAKDSTPPECTECPSYEKAGWRRVAYVSADGQTLCYRHIVSREEVS